MNSFRFLHAADIHLDSPLTGLARYEGLPVEDVRGATRTAFDNLIRFACKEAVDFVILAGDLFDGDWRDMGTGLYFARAMGILAQADVPVFLLQGNHDAGSVLTKTLPWPDNVHRFSTRAPQTYKLDALGVALHGWSFAHQAAPDNLVPRYPSAEAGLFNIGVLHTSLSGRPGHDRYAPCDLADLHARGYDYWALGHVHAFERVSEEPPVIFPGNIQGRNIRETGPKGAVLVDVEHGEIASIQHVELDVLRWARAVVDCTGCTNIDAVQSRIRGRLSELRAAEPADRGMVVRVILEGETDLAGRLDDQAGQLREDTRALAAGVAADLWIEKLSVQARSPMSTSPQEGADDLVAMLAGAEADGALADALAAELMPFLSATTPVPQPEADDLRRAAMDGNWQRVAAAASAALRGRFDAVA